MHYERLSSQDAFFLAVESPNAPQHVGTTLLYDATPMRTPEGRFDVDRFRRFTESVLHLLPRYRQRLAFIPGERHPVWVDDETFDLDYHVRHVALPPPGSEDQLKRLAARIFARPLDLRKPLWETWVVEGIEGDRFATLCKVHHSVLDGAAGMNQMAVMHALEPRSAIGEPEPWTPRPAPGGRELIAGELGRRLSDVRAFAAGAREAIRDPRGILDQGAQVLDGFREALVGKGLRSASRTILNEPIGPHRRLEWLELDLAEVKSIKNALGGTVNDVLVSIATGVLRGYFLDRRVPVTGLDFRAGMPVAVRGADDRPTGNSVAGLILELPLEDPDPASRYRTIVERTGHLKRSNQGRAVRFLAELADRTLPGLYIAPVRYSARHLSYNTIVSNVPGPSSPCTCSSRGCWPAIPT